MTSWIQERDNEKFIRHIERAHKMKEDPNTWTKDHVQLWIDSLDLWTAHAEVKRLFCEVDGARLMNGDKDILVSKVPNEWRGYMRRVITTLRRDNIDLEKLQAEVTRLTAAVERIEKLLV
jgi:hypothetical protein